MAAPIEKEDLFNQILARNEERFLFIARHYASGSEARDLHQEILCQILNSLDRFEGRSDPSTWAYRIALNTAGMYLRKRRRWEQASQACGRNVPPVHRGERGEDQILREFTESLPEVERIIFTLFLTQLGYREIAEVVGIPEPTLRVKISRIKDQFEQRYL